MELADAYYMLEKYAEIKAQREPTIDPDEE